MSSSSFTLQVPDGTAVHVHRWLPDGDVRGAVQIAHGLAEHGARYAHVADALTAQGYAVYASDLRGHGLTAQTEDDLGFFAESRGWATVLDDLYRLNRRIHEDHPGVPVLLLGHSMGSYLAQQYLFTFPATIHGAVLSGSTRHLLPIVEAGAALARAEIKRIGPRGRSDVLHLAVFGPYRLAFAPVRTDFDHLSRDPEQVDVYVDDPLCGFKLTARMWLDIFSGLRVIRQVERLEAIPKDMPIYVLSGDKDPVGDASKGVERLLDAYASAGLTHVASRLYEDGRHEMFNEINRDEVIDDLVKWVEATTTAAEAGR